MGAGGGALWRYQLATHAIFPDAVLCSTVAMHAPPAVKACLRLAPAPTDVLVSYAALREMIFPCLNRGHAYGDEVQLQGIPMDVDAVAPSSGVRTGKGPKVPAPEPASRLKAGGRALAAIVADVTWTRTAAGRRLRPRRPRPSLLPRARTRAKVVRAARAKARARRSSTGYVCPGLSLVGSQGGGLPRRHVHRRRRAWSGLREHHVGSLERRSVRQRLGSAANDRLGCMPQRVPPRLVLLAADASRDELPAGNDGYGQAAQLLPDGAVRHVGGRSAELGFFRRGRDPADLGGGRLAAEENRAGLR